MDFVLFLGCVMVFMLLATKCAQYRGTMLAAAMYLQMVGVSAMPSLTATIGTLGAALIVPTSYLYTGVKIASVVKHTADTGAELATDMVDRTAAAVEEAGEDALYGFSMAWRVMLFLIACGALMRFARWLIPASYFRESIENTREEAAALVPAPRLPFSPLSPAPNPMQQRQSRRMAPRRRSSKVRSAVKRVVVSRKRAKRVKPAERQK